MSNKYKDVPVEDTKLRFRPSMATDGIIFALFDTDETDQKFYSGEAHVLLVKRGAVESKGKRKGKARPDLGYWALPGGFVRSEETLQDAVLRELAEETLFPKKEFLSSFEKGIVGLKQIKTYSEPKRDSWICFSELLKQTSFGQFRGTNPTTESPVYFVLPGWPSSGQFANSSA